MMNDTAFRGRTPVVPFAAMVLLALGVALAGCGPAGPKRYRMQGTVTYRGQPVHAGRVIFEPDLDRGNAGPAAYADIRAGQYSTLDGLGSVGGPHTMRVICLTGQPEGSELAEGRMVCPEYRQSVDLPHAAGELAIEVPESLTWQP